MFEQTLNSNNKIRLSPEYQALAGVDKTGVPRLLPSRPDGRLELGGADLPKFDTFAIAFWGTTNNIKTVIYTLLSVEVARWTFAYAGGGAANDDVLTSGVLTVV